MSPDEDTSCPLCSGGTLETLGQLGNLVYLKCRQCGAQVSLQAEEVTKEAPDKDEVCCKVCGSLNVQFAVWHSPNTGAMHDLFGSWNAGDNTFCEDCDQEGRDPNPDLIYASEDPKLFKKLRTKRAKLDAKLDNKVS